MKVDSIVAILIGVVLLATVALCFAVIAANKIKSKQSLKVNNDGRIDFLVSSYNFFSQLIITKKYLNHIRKRVEIFEITDTWTINRKTMRLAYISSITSFLLFILLMFLDHSLYFIIISILTILIINKQIIKLMVDKIEDKLINQFDKFLGNTRHHFNEHGMIDEAIYDSIESCDYEISIHANKMYEVLTASNVDYELNKYYDIVPNKFIKTFLALCYTVQKFGDRVIGDSSMFLSNLNYLRQEINLELLKRQKLRYLFSNLSIIGMLPIFFIKPLENWAVNSMPEFIAYYKGAYGFVVQILLFLIVILCYQLINKMQTTRQDETQLFGNFENKILRLSFVSSMVDRVIAKQYSKTKRLEKLLIFSNTKISVEQFYLKRLLYGILGFGITIIVVFNIHIVTRYNLLNPFDFNNNQINDEAVKEIQELDNKMIKEYSGKNITYQDIEERLIEEDNIKDSQIIALSAKRILEKIRSYNNQYFKWWELLISLLSGVIFYYVPYILLIYKQSIVKMNMEDEVLQFHTIILMLMHIERMSVEDILEWMELFADIFKESISKCLNNFEYGDYEALEQLKIDEPYPPFIKIIENLQAATDKITIESAFDELKLERGYYQEKRKQDNEISTNKKGSWGRIISFIPMSCTILFYLLVPFMHLSINQFLSYTNQISNY